LDVLLSADCISKSFGAREVLKSASLRAHPGRISVLFGRNGCGKSTLLKIAAGVMQADQGVVGFAGQVFLRPRLHRLARAGLFYLPDRDLLAPHLSLRQHLAALAWHFRTDPATPVLARLGLLNVLDQPVAELSGGELRRAEVAVAVVRAPRCLLADEPFAGITPADADVLASVFRDLADRGCALILTGHEVPQLLAVADDVEWMIAGTTHHLGTAAQATAHDGFRKEYLGPPHLA
jgi:lipopolysaccharide export system ATP-binding protein